MSEIDYAKLKVEEIRQMIVDDSKGKVKLEDVDQIKGKKGLVEAHKQIVGSDFDSFFKELEESTKVQQVEHIMPDDAPDYHSPEWEDFLLSQLMDNEKDRGCPKVNGLRRLAETFLGEIVFSGPIEYQSIRLNDGMDRISVLYEVHISWNRDIVGRDISNFVPTIRKFRALSSSSHLNTDTDYAAFGESIADTRGEARALRRALRISQVSSDEITNKDTGLALMESLPEIDMDKIGSVQKTSITLMCERLGIDVNKFINSGKNQYNSLDDISRQTATAMVKRLNDFQNCSTESILIPEDLKVKNEG
jgi:hypothetical protein